MSKDIESQMRAALRAVAPSEEFTQKLVANVTSRLPAPPKPRRFALFRMSFGVECFY